jgi:hypothetical protein
VVDVIVIGAGLSGFVESGHRVAEEADRAR